MVLRSSEKSVTKSLQIYGRRRISKKWTIQKFHIDSGNTQQMAQLYISEVERAILATDGAIEASVNLLAREVSQLHGFDVQCF